MPHTITDDFADGFHPSVFNRDLPWKCHTQSPMTLQMDYNPSIFIGNSQLPTISPTDGANSKGRVLNAS
jgi:hypothetical protein